MLKIFQVFVTIKFTIKFNENRKRRRSEDRTVEQIEKRSKNREKQAEAENKGYNKGKIDLDNRTEWTIDPDNREEKTDSKTTIDVPDNREDNSRSVKTIDRIGISAKNQTEENPQKAIRKSRKFKLLKEGQLQKNKISKYFTTKTTSVGEGERIPKKQFNKKDNLIDNNGQGTKNVETLTKFFESRSSGSEERKRTERYMGEHAGEETGELVTKLR